MRQGNLEQATLDMRADLELVRRLGLKFDIAIALHNLGELYTMQGNLETAVAHFQESIVLTREFNNTRVTAVGLLYLGLCYHIQRDYHSALETVGKAVEIMQEQKSHPDLVECLDVLGMIASKQGEFAKGAALLGAGEALHDVFGTLIPRSFQAPREEALAALTSGLGENDLDSALAEGRKLTLEQALELAMKNS